MNFMLKSSVCRRVQVQIAQLEGADTVWVL